MNRSFSLIFVLTLILMLLAVGPAMATDNAPAAKAQKLMIRQMDGSEDSPVGNGGPLLGSSSFAPGPQPPGDTVGITRYEFQKNGSMGRQIAYTPSLSGSPYVHFIWMKSPGTAGFRHINYNARNLTNGAWAHSSGASGGTEVSGNNGGYTTIDVTSSGAAVGAWHEGPAAALYRTRSGPDSSPPNGTFATVFSPSPSNLAIPNCQDFASGTQEGDAYIWPAVEYQLTSGLDEVIHLVSTESPPETVQGEYWKSLIYYRYVNGEFDKCTAGDSVGLYIETTYDIAGVVRSDPNPTRDNVAIVYLKPLTLDLTQLPCTTWTTFANEVYYIESTNGGANWGVPVNVTNYSDGGANNYEDARLWANNEVSAIYDSAGVLHIIWVTPDKDMEDNPCQPLFRSSMWHWSNDQAPGVNISQVLDATGVTGFCSQGIGAGLGAISKVNISECYTGSSELLYVMFTQFGVEATEGGGQLNCGDCSNGGYANGDIMITASSDGGITWGPDGSLPEHDTTSTAGTGTPVKKGTTVDLTNTWTDDCLGGDCHNENFGSMAKYSVDEVHIMYVDDNDAGSFIQEEGTETDNAMKYMTYDCFSPEPIFDYATGAQSYDLVVSPNDSTGCTIGVTTTFELRLTNNGNVPIGFTLTPNQGWISPATTSGSITAGIDATHTITVTIGPVAAEGNYSGTIAVSLTSSAGSANFDVNISLRARCQYYADEYSDPYLSTQCWSVAVWNVGRAGLAAASALGNMYWFEDSVDLMYDEGVVITYADDPSQTYFSFFDGSDDNVYFEGASVLTLESHSNYDYAKGEFITPDKVVRGVAEYYVPTHPDTCVLIERVTFINHADTTIRIHIGEGIDWDIPDGADGSDNRSGADGTGQYVYQYGPIADPQQDYYGGAAFSHEIAGAIVLENDIWVYPNSGYVPADIGNLLTTLSGFTASDPDSIEDLNSFYAVCQDLEIEPGKSITVCKVKTSSLTGKTDFDNLIAKGRLWIAANGLSCPGCAGIICLEGDADGSTGVDIDDVVYLIAYIFTGGPPPVAAVCCGDADGSGGVDIDDVVYLIAYIFTGGPAPIYSC
ncbi:MAG: hypothetical protein KJ723_13265 [candidate division Zixibacteria bacterium]|nr:hypothetical protein [candidate division Zixibacteria bacterium]